MAKVVIERLDGRSTADDIAGDVSAAGLEITGEQIRSWIERDFAQIGILADEPLERQSSLARRPDAAVAHAKVLLSPDLVWNVSRRLGALYARPYVWWCVLAIAVMQTVLYGPYRDVGFYSRANISLAVGIAIPTLLLHELGHTSALTRFGVHPGGIGVGFYLLLPTFFANVSGVWLLPRRERLIVDIGGVYFQLLASSLLVFVAVLALSPELFLAARLVSISALFALLPVFRFDGYWLLADYLDVRSLWKTAMASLEQAWRPSRALPAPAVAGRRAVLVWFYLFLSVGAVGVLMWLQYRQVYVPLAKLPRTLPMAGQALAKAWAKQDYLRLLNVVWALALSILLSLVGGLTIGRYIRRCWRAGTALLPAFREQRWR